GLLAAPLHHVAIHRVPAGVADAADEPAAIDAGVWIEHLLRGLDPIDVPGGLAPECLRVALPAGIDLVIAAGAGVPGAYSDRRGLARCLAPHCEARRGLCKSPTGGKAAVRQNAGVRRRPEL